MTEHELHTLTGAYAVDALDEDERRLFRAHLAECESCRQEVAGLAATAARLGSAVAEPPPPGMRERVLARAAATRQLPPSTGSAARRAELPWFRQPLGIAASFLLVVALGLAAFAFTENRRADQAETLANRIAAVATDPQRSQAQRPVTSGGISTLVSADGQAVFRAVGLTPLPADRTYQLWVIDKSGPRPAGMLGRGGDVSHFVPKVRATDTIGLTVEPKGGSKTPTTDPVVTIPVRT